MPAYRVYAFFVPKIKNRMHCKAFLILNQGTIAQSSSANGGLFGVKIQLEIHFEIERRLQMENVMERKVFNFTKENTGHVKLHLGETYTIRHDQCNNEDVKAFDAAPFCYRWMITSDNSPLPVKNGAWFQGFPAHIMVRWFRDQGYVLQSVVDTCRGNILFQAAKEEPKKTPREIRRIERGFYTLAKREKITAVFMYGAIYGCDLAKAKEMIDDILERYDREEE